MENSELIIEGRNAIIEAFRAGRSVDKLFIQEHTKEGSMNTLIREAKKTKTLIKYVPKIEMWLENFNKLFEFKVELEGTDTENSANSNQNTYYLNPANSSTGVEKTITVDEEHATIETEFSGGHLDWLKEDNRNFLIDKIAKFLKRIENKTP